MGEKNMQAYWVMIGFCILFIIAAIFWIPRPYPFFTAHLEKGWLNISGPSAVWNITVINASGNYTLQVHIPAKVWVGEGARVKIWQADRNYWEYGSVQHPYEVWG